MRPPRLSPHRPFVCQSCRNASLLARRNLATTAKSDPEIYDVVCVGGGPVGLALLAALRASPVTSRLKVALVETQDLSKSREWNPPVDMYSNRASSLTPSSVDFLQRIGAWEHFDQSRIQPYNEMQVWDGSSGSNITFDGSIEPSTQHKSGIATMAENSNIVRALLRRTDTLPKDGLSIFTQTTASAIENGEDDLEGLDLSAWPVLSLSSNSSSTGASLKSIAARLLVGADGINSPVRSFAGIGTSGWDYDRHGVVATLDLEPSFASTATAYQRFLPALGGPIALLPLPDNKASLVWSTKSQNAAYVKSLPPDAFTSMVNAAFRLSMTDLSYMLTLPSTPSSETQHADELSWRIPHTQLPSQLPPLVTSVHPNTIASFPLRFRHASSYVSPRIALLGDAAHTIHPLAGQGLNLGLADAASLSRTIEYAVLHGMDIGDLLSLERYSQERYGPNAKIGGVCDVLHWVYGVESGPIAWARGLGADVLNKLPSVKGFLMQQASGR